MPTVVSVITASRSLRRRQPGHRQATGGDGRGGEVIGEMARAACATGRPRAGRAGSVPSPACPRGVVSLARRAGESSAVAGASPAERGDRASRHGARGERPPSGQCVAPAHHLLTCSNRRVHGSGRGVLWQGCRDGGLQPWGRVGGERCLPIHQCRGVSAGSRGARRTAQPSCSPGVEGRPTGRCPGGWSGGVSLGERRSRRTPRAAAARRRNQVEELLVDCRRGVSRGAAGMVGMTVPPGSGVDGLPVPALAGDGDLAGLGLLGDRDAQLSTPAS